jgi:hypothetical protein
VGVTLAVIYEGDAAAERLTELLGYVEQVIKLDERPAFRLGEYRLPTGQTFVFHQHEFHGLPGVTHDLVDEDGPIWLTMRRLKRGEPPEPSESLAPWLDVSPDPDNETIVRESFIRTVSESEKNDLLALGKVRHEDCTEAMGPHAEGRFDVIFRIEDHPEITIEAQSYLFASYRFTVTYCRGGFETVHPLVSRSASPRQSDDQCPLLGVKRTSMRPVLRRLRPV